MPKTPIVNSPERNKMLRRAFLESAGITDETPYASMQLEEVIRTIIKNADIKTTKIGPAIYSRDRLIVTAQSHPVYARRLGESLRPFLDTAGKEGRINRRSGEHNPQWDIKHQAKTIQQETLLRSDFCIIAGIVDDFSQCTLLDFMHSKYKILHQNSGLNYDMIGKRFTPPVTKLYIAHRLSGYLSYDRDFVIQFAEAIKPYLIKGVKECWLDETKNPLPDEKILLQQLGVSNDFLAGKRGMQALLHCIDKSGLPFAAVSSLVGEDWSWIARIKNTAGLFGNGKNVSFRQANLREKTFLPSEVARIARAIKPYVLGKVFNGVLEITDSTYLRTHEKAKNYVIHKLKNSLPVTLASEVDMVLDGLDHLDVSQRNTLGPTLKAMRLHTNLKQSDFAPEFMGKEFGRHERNCFNPRCVDENGELNATMRKRLDRFVEVLAKRWLAKDASLSWAARETMRSSGRDAWVRD